MSARSNQWEIILYPESLPEKTWQEIIFSTKVPCVLSPCHNMDFMTELDVEKGYKDKLKEFPAMTRAEYENIFYAVGDVKKEHYHLIVNYGNGANKSMEQVQEDFCIPLNSKKVPEIVKSERGAVRYLCHLDHPQKAQYRIDEVRFFNGYNPKDYFDISNADVDRLNIDIIQFIDDNNVSGYYELERITRKWLPWHKYIVSHSIFFTYFFNDRLQSQSELKKYHYDDLSEKVLKFVNNIQ